MENVTKSVASKKTFQKWLLMAALFAASVFVYPYPSWISVCETHLEIVPPFTSDWVLQTFLIFYIAITGFFWGGEKYGFVLAAGPPLLITLLTLFCFKFFQKNSRLSDWLSASRSRRRLIF